MFEKLRIQALINKGKWTEAARLIPSGREYEFVFPDSGSICSFQAVVYKENRVHGLGISLKTDFRTFTVTVKRAEK